MKLTSKFKTAGLGIALGFMAVACNPETRQEANEEVNEAQAEVTDATVAADNEYDDFSAWVRTNTDKAETATADEWNEIDTEYSRREAELDAKSDTWDDQTKQEWQELKNDWKETRAKAKQRLGNVDDVDVDIDADVDTN
ncbi:hypothetical protein I2I11_03775 [Pontibacter sp. 172403-2]|uniref:hypothetical protein n=1 Tax=Pontibacter rufus TaxID=2791028 RepID=UPI0018AF7201|nr:hypothetical protein [Pontibacter sp. 172403-2]MBF9252403.1 hypothetical protein [Pontibacter sp. 172403-2]